MTALLVVLLVLPIDLVVDDPRNMPPGIVAHTTIVLGRCVLTFTPESIRRPEVVAHERCHCELDADVIGPYGYEGITERERRQREARASRCARGRQ